MNENDIKPRKLWVSKEDIEHIEKTIEEWRRFGVPENYLKDLKNKLIEAYGKPKDE